MALYASLNEGKDELNATNTTDDERLLGYLRTVSARIDRQFQSRRRLFEPYIESRSIRVDSAHVSSLDNTLTLNGPLLALTSVTLGSTSIAVGSAVDIFPALASPARQLRLSDWSVGWYDYCTSNSAPLFATINGVWGIHRDYPNAWLKVDDVTTTAITSTTATTFTVASASGADPYNRTPRLSVGNLIKVDDEYMEIVAISTNTLTVIRGVNGSTAATHEIGADVSVWQVEDPIKRACARQAGMLYARRGAYESGNVTDFGIVNYPSDLLLELREIVAEYAYE
jgi:hypothetical protein